MTAAVALAFRFTPTPSSWLNAVEAFSAPTRRRLRRGVFGSIVELQEAINRYIVEHIYQSASRR